jgi:hypothetical protein
VIEEGGEMKFSTLWRKQGKTVYWSGGSNSARAGRYYVGAQEFWQEGCERFEDQIPYLALWSRCDWDAEAEPAILVAENEEDYPADMITAFEEIAYTRDISR